MPEYTVAAICPECVSVVGKDDVDAAHETVYAHNDARHDGEAVAEVVEHYRDDLNDFMDGVRDAYGSERYGELAATIMDQDPFNAYDDLDAEARQ